MVLEGAKQGGREISTISSSLSHYKDEEARVDELDDSGYQLVLPSGATIGHRSLQRYFDMID